MRIAFGDELKYYELYLSEQFEESLNYPRKTEIIRLRSRAVIEYLRQKLI